MNRHETCKLLKEISEEINNKGKWTTQAVGLHLVGQHDGVTAIIALKDLGSEIVGGVNYTAHRPATKTNPSFGFCQNKEFNNSYSIELTVDNCLLAFDKMLDKVSPL